MEDSPIGELFRNKLSQREFEKKDAYWKDAEQLIIKYNKRRRNRLVLFFLIAILLITTFLGGLFDYYSGNVESEKSLALNNVATSEANKGGLENGVSKSESTFSVESGTEKPIGLSSEVASEKFGDGPDDLPLAEDLPKNEDGDSERSIGLDDIPLPEDLSENEEVGTDKSGAITEDAAPKINKDTLPTSTTADAITSNLTAQSDIIRKDSIKSSLSLNLYGSGFYVNKFLATTDQSFDNHVDRRTKEEQSILSYGAGVELNYHFDNWLISAGVAFSNLGEKTNYSPNVREQTDAIKSDNSYWRIATFTYWITDSIGNPELVQIVDSNYIEVINSIDTTYTITDSSVAGQNGSTKLTYIEIPVLIGYDLTLNKLRLSIRTGLSLGYLAMSKGYYLNRSNEQLLNIGTTPNQFNSFTLSYLLRIGTNYKLNESIDLFVEPAFKLNLNSVLEQQYDISQKYYSIGLNLGVNYRL